MLRKSSRISLALCLLLTSEVWALGLGEIRLDSALNEPLRAEIELISATPEELANLTISLASPETFERYGLDRPAYLQNLRFEVVSGTRAGDSVIEIRSAQPITEPFLTFLVEAAWARGRLLREYTVLLDPPTFAPPATAESTPPVTAPTRTAPADSGRIERPAPLPAAEPAPRPEPIRPPRASEPVAEPADEPPPAPVPQEEDEPVDEPAYAAVPGDQVYVQRGDTLWGIAERNRPDGRLSMNQAMLAIFEANPDAFGGNINLLRAGATLRIPSADRMFSIDRADAFREAQRQNEAWGIAGPSTPAVAETTTRPDLTLVPPDEDYVDDGLGDSSGISDTPLTREDEIQARIDELEAANVPEQQSLIEIRNNELAALRQELAELRGEVYTPPVDDAAAADAMPEATADDIVAEDEVLAEDSTVDDTAAAGSESAEDEVATEVAEPPPAARPAPRFQPEPTLVDRALGVLTNFWTILVAALAIVGGVLFWFVRRGRGEDDEPARWHSPDAGDVDDLSSTESMPAPTGDDDSFVVVEQPSGEHEQLREQIEKTQETPTPSWGAEAADEEQPVSGRFESLEDTFSSETAVNLDQSDPIAEADFHMAYGLYDQAADLINGALEADPERQDLLTKLCEIYFVWGNRDAFVDAAGRLKDVVGDGESADWDKIVIMGQQIAGEDALFAGAAVAGATRAVDLSFEAGMDETGSLDMELIADGTSENEVFDIGAADEDDTVAAFAETGIDFDLGGDTAETQAASEPEIDDVGSDSEVDIDLSDDSGVVDFDLTAAGMPSTDEPTTEAPAADEPTTDATAAVEPDFDLSEDMPETDATSEMPAVETTRSTPTIEEQLADLGGGTAELPSLEDALEEAAQGGDATAEINLDDLGLDVSDLEETEVASLDDVDEPAGDYELSETGLREAFGGADDDDETGLDEALGDDGTSRNAALEDVSDATGRNPEVDPDATGAQTTMVADDDVFDDSLLEATGVTQVLSPDDAVESGRSLSDEDATMLAPGFGDDQEDDVPGDEQETLLADLDDDEDEGDYDFAKTEALPADVFTGIASLDETGELPAVASTDLDLDLDDLTAALQVSDTADTVEQPRDDATVQQPRPGNWDTDDEDAAATMSLGPEDFDDDLSEARTMTEVGTKLDLARAYVDMGDPAGARSILEEVLDEGDAGQRQQAQQLLDSLPS